MKNCLIFMYLALLGLLNVSNGNFYIAIAPKKMKFISNDDQTVRRRELPGIINFLMGLPSYHLHRTESWPGLEGVDVFNPPRANILINLHLPKGNDFALSQYVIKYTTDNLESRVPPVLELNSALLEEKDGKNLVQVFTVSQQFPGTSYDEVDVQKIKELLNGEDSLVDGLPWKLKSLEKKSDTDIQLFGEIEMLLGVIDSMNEVKVGKKLSIHIILTSLDQLAREHGATSPQVEEGIKLFEYYIPQFIEAMATKYNGRLLCEVDVTSGPPAIPEYSIRHSRQVLQSEEPADVVLEVATNFTKLNLAEPNRAEFAVIFNIVLWLVIGFSLAVAAATYSMAYMDPGKDNIIYRVTSQRIKSD